MDQASIHQYILSTFAGVDVTEAMNAVFFFFDPKKMFPFATIVTTDEHDQASNLNRPGVFRLNIGVGKETFQSLFGSKPGGDAAYDFTALDTIMPHPVYGMMYWICVLNPSDATFETLKPMLAEAYEMAMKRISKSKPTGNDK